MRFLSVDMLIVSGEWWVRIERYDDIKEGDTLEFYEIEEKARTL